MFPVFHSLDLIAPSKPNSKENCFDLTIFCGAGGSFLVVAGRLVHANVQQNEGYLAFFVHYHTVLRQYFCCVGSVKLTVVENMRYEK